MSYVSLVGNGLMVSRDAGNSWQRLERSQEFLTLAGDPESADRLWAGSATGLYLSEDGGETFNLLQNVPVNTLAVNPSNPDHLVIGGRKIYTSQDGGASLQEAEYADLSMFVNDIVFAATGSNVVYAAAGGFYEAGLLKGGRGVLRSTDGGETWHSFSRGLANKDVTKLLPAPDGKHLYVDTVGGSVYRIKLNQGK